MRKTNTMVIISLLVVSIVVNIILATILINIKLKSESYEGTWKYSTSSTYETTLFIDHNGTFYMADSADGRLYNVSKGHIENDILVFSGVRSIQETDHYEYLSDIPEELYTEVNYFYVINRTSENTFTLRTSTDQGTKFVFIRVSE